MRLLTGAIVALSLAAPGAALAAPIANAQGWTGFYVGGHVGGLRPDFDGFFDSNDPPTNFDTMDDWLFNGGGQIGYDYQGPGMHGVVIGIVLDASAVTGEANAIEPDLGFPDTHISAEIDWIASARIRAGYPVADIMPYFTAGVAMAEFTVNHTRAPFDPGLPLPWSINEQEVGWVGGIGMDWAIMPNVTIGAEALWYSFDYSQDLQGFPDGDPNGDNISFDGLLSVRATANYRF